MKKIYYLFATILVLGFVGCTTDVVENEIITVPQDITLDVAIPNPQTKVELGEKGDNDKYPMYWSEGDKISANGYISEEAVISSENRGSAQFEFKNAILNYPYNVLYPASADGTVEFATTQYYKEGTFMSGTTPLYAVVSNKNEKISLKHLSGVVRLSLLAPSKATTLESLTVTAAEGSIAGIFEMDFAGGKLVPTEEVYSSLNYSFNDGLALSQSEAKNIFIVLPSGNFGICTIEVHTTAGEVMSLRFNTTNSAIKAGIVREFSPVTFKAGAQSTLTPFGSEEDEFEIDESIYAKTPTTFDGEWLVVNDAQELIWLCQNQPYLNNTEYRKIRIGENFRMGMYDGLNLQSLQLYEGTEIDGNNKSITGLSMDEGASSIFGDGKNLNIHDLTLTDCSVNTELQTGAAILVGKADEGLTVSNVTFNNCSVVAPCKIGLVAGAMHTGTFNISGVTADGDCLVETSYVSGKSGMAGGLVGDFAKNGTGATTSTATFTNCTTSATVKAYMEAANYFYGKMVGMFGGYNGDEKLYFVNCDAANATLVPLYDKGKKNAETAILSYCEAHRAEFCETTLNNATDNLLGGEYYCRGEVYYDGNRFVAEWDGKREVSMITTKEVVDDVEVTIYYVYSPYDLAAAQDTGYSNSKRLVLKTDVDMGAHAFVPIYYVRDLDGENHSIYNVKVNFTQTDANFGAGLISAASNTTTHKNLTIVNADITCNHDASIPELEYGNDEDGVAGNAYAGVLVSRVKNGTYIASNIHVRSSKVRGVCKVGGLIGTITATTATVENCSVDGTVVENYDPQVVNYYKMYKEIDFLGTYIAEGLQWWYTAGECGGLVGFVASKTANITNCSVTNCNINCTGQENKEVVVNVFNSSNYVAGAYTSGADTFMLARTTVAGRHINQFIGNIRSQRTEAQQEAGSGEYTTIITDYTVSGNKYNGVSADSTNDYNHEYASGTYCPVVGCAYYTGVDMSILLMNVHVQHCAGTLTFNAKGGSATTLTEAIGKGSSMAWFGGNGSTSSGKSYYPAAPTE